MKSGSEYMQINVNRAEYSHIHELFFSGLSPKGLWLRRNMNKWLANSAI
jgi:hypothetical protein